jgi:hypothetical protein
MIDAFFIGIVIGIISICFYELWKEHRRRAWQKELKAQRRRMMAVHHERLMDELNRWSKGEL